MRSSIYMFLAVLLMWPMAAWALSVDEPLADATQEARAKALFPDIRCVVCQGESIADSPAEVAHDMRQAIREMIARGMSDKEIHAFLTSRYGDGILMRPPLKAATALLWFGPLLILAGAAWLMLRFFRPRARGEA